MKKKVFPKEYFVTTMLFSFIGILVLLIFIINVEQERSLQRKVESNYQTLLSLFNPHYPGRGLQDYEGSINDDYAKSYAVFLSAEINRAKNKDPFQLSYIGVTAGEWLLNNGDKNGNGIVGWELPVAWDAYGDGTINPAGTEYTITTGIVINALLDWYENDPKAPKDRIIQIVEAAIQPFIDGSHITIDGFIPYSFSNNDDSYNTYNSAIYLLGQLQRFSTLIDSPDFEILLLDFIDSAITKVISEHKELSDGSWYWVYGDQSDRLNELAHSVYIVDGIRTYILYSGSRANQIEWKKVLKYLDNFSNYNGLSVYEYPPMSDETLNDYPRLYDLGSYIRLVSLCKPNLILLKNLVGLSEMYRLPSGHYAKYIYPESDAELFINEYESFILYGWSIILSNQQGACLRK